VGFCKAVGTQEVQNSLQLPTCGLLVVVLCMQQHLACQFCAGA
jgi:hypothetical protein